MDIKLGVSYFGIRNPQHVERDLDQIVEAGCNTILHTFSENDFYYYRQTMHEIVKLSHKRKLEVYIDPWGVGGIFGGEAFTHFALRNDKSRQVLSDGRLAPAACPNNEAFREFMHEWIAAAVEIEADIIFWDEPHFYLPEWYGEDPGLWACRCERCQNLFHKKYGYPLPERINTDVRNFKEESLSDFIREMTEVAKSKGTKTALCLLPEWDNPQKQKWDRYVSLKSLDIFGSDPYWMWAGKKFADFEFHVRKVKQLTQKYHKEPQIWIQAVKVRKGEEEKVRESVKVAYQNGIKNIMAWSYLGTAYMSWVRSERPQRVWEELKRAYLEVLREQYLRGKATL